MFQPGELNSLLEQTGYIKDIENAAYDFVTNHINNAPIHGVFNRRSITNGLYQTACEQVLEHTGIANI